ncbi:MAG TPA: DnaA N-terminal domain-containing protein, partial [Acidobacteriota bacterium]|nr:DnaA N-terminal domain-containing protein [Acidobacteriota bacterium]
MDKTQWEAFLLELEKRINHESFNTWFKPLTFHSSTDAEYNIGVPNELFRNWIEEHYSEILEESLVAIGISHLVPALVITDQATEATANNQSAAVPDIYHPPTNGSRSLYPAEPANSNANTRYLDLEPTELPLNPKYTFETFVVGSC